MATRTALILFLSLFLLATPALADRYDRGEAAYVSGDYDAAREHFHPLAEAGDPRAQFRLGMMAEWGQGMRPDFTEAVRWYRLAAEQGERNAQFTLGFMYGSGTGVRPDPVQAWAWFELAARQGDSEAADFRDATAGRLGAEELDSARQLAQTLLASR